MEGPNDSSRNPENIGAAGAEERATGSHIESEKDSIVEELEKHDLFGIVAGNYATVEGWSNFYLGKGGSIEFGVETMEKYGYELNGPISVTYVPQEGLPYNIAKRGEGEEIKGAILEKATFRKKQSQPS